MDNFCWGNPALPDRMGALVRAAQGCHDAALAYGASGYLNKPIKPETLVRNAKDGLGLP